MRPLLHPRLINSAFDDPGLFINRLHARQALLFDLGEINALSSRDLLKVSHIFISHTHMDHFIGFDTLVRLMLGREKTLNLYGPAGIIDNVAGKLRGYTWNLVNQYDHRLIIRVNEVTDHQVRTVSFPCGNGFEPSDSTMARRQGAVIAATGTWQVATARLDHRTPSLAFALTERFHINIIKVNLDALGLPVGPWLNRFKDLLYQDADPQQSITVPDAQGRPAAGYTIGELRDRIVRITPGQKIAYITDAVGTPDNIDRMVALAHRADHLFIEAVFMNRHRDQALRKHHLTARQAGRVARLAQVRQYTLFHHSPRYRDQQQQLEAEARAAFQDLDGI